DNDNAKQIAQVEDVLNQGAKVLVIQPTDSQAASAYVRLAHEHGAKVVAYDRAIVSPDLDYYVSHDSYRVGVLQAEAALKATGGKGKFILLSGQAGHSVAAEITRGYEHTLAPYVARGDVEIVVQQNHSAWSPEQALRTVEDALTRTGNHIDAILANNSGMARGAGVRRRRSCARSASGSRARARSRDQAGAEAGRGDRADHDGRDGVGDQARRGEGPRGRRRAVRAARLRAHAAVGELDTARAIP